MLVGPSGTGKSHFAEAICHAAIDVDLRVSWFSLESLTAVIARSKVDATTAKVVARICYAELIVVDDIGLLLAGEDEAEALYRLVDAAYEWRSLILTSNLHPGRFDTIFPKGLATAAVDRLSITPMWSSPRASRSAWPTRSRAAACSGSRQNARPANHSLHPAHHERADPHLVSQRSRGHARHGACIGGRPMRLRIPLVVALVAMLALPAATLAANPKKAPDLGTNYTRREVPLADGALAVYESIALDGTLLTDEIRATADWQALATTGVENPSVMTDEGVTIQATAYKTIGRRFSAFNSLGWLVIQYTIWQEFGYNGTNITYYPAPTYDHEANWGWTMKSHSETAWWVSSPTHRASRGNYYFKYEVWSPFGNIGWNEKSGWVRVDYYGSGSWTGSNS